MPNLNPPIWALAAGEDHSLAMQYDAFLYGWWNPQLIPAVFRAPVIGVS